MNGLDPFVKRAGLVAPAVGRAVGRQPCVSPFGDDLSWVETRCPRSHPFPGWPASCDYVMPGVTGRPSWPDMGHLYRATLPSGLLVGPPGGVVGLALLLSLSLWPLPLLSLPLVSVSRALLNDPAARVHCRGCLLRNPTPDSSP